jgi:hypothetical protein
MALRTVVQCDVCHKKFTLEVGSLMLEVISESDSKKRDAKRRKSYDARISRHQCSGQLLTTEIMCID